MDKKIQTVLGPIDKDDIGITLMHEHCLIDLSAGFKKPKEISQRRLAHQKITLENLGWVRFNISSNFDNLILSDEQEMVKELELFKWAGGKTIVDCTMDDLGRDPSALSRISRAVGINIVMGSGYYIGVHHGSNYIDRSGLGNEQEMAEEMIQDIMIGVRNTGVKAGIIGEIGCSWPLLDTEKKVLKAAAIAQQKTGAAITIHPGRSEEAPMEIIKILDENGTDPSRVIIGHIGRTITSFNKLLDLSKTGCYLEFDHFGREVSIIKGHPILNDTARIETIQKLIDKGIIDQLLISQDICSKHRLRRYGGAGFGHIIDNVVPQMLYMGLKKEEIDKMLIENPKNVLPF